MSDDRLHVGKYEITGTLGKGGMGVVYRGIDPVIQRAVAIKLIRKAEIGTADLAHVLERFRHEAQAAGNLQHPNIVAIYEYGEDAEHAFIAMECVTGRSLREHIVGGWRPEFRSFPEVLAQLFEGLDYSHAQGVIHRDIKPANLLVSESGVVKISDFGIARVERRAAGTSDEIVGTPFYMSPEQYQGLPVDERTDLYSAAVIAFEVVTGRRPFTGGAESLKRQVLNDPPPPPSTLEPRVTHELDEVILRGLSKHPDDRYRTAREFVEALQHAFYSRSPSFPVVAPVRGENTTAPVPPFSATRPISIVPNASLLRRAIGAMRAESPPPAAPVAPAPAPVASAPVAASPEATDTRDGPRRPCILFVDDEERILNSLRTLFRGTYDAEFAASGDEALRILHAKKVHLLVSDQRMPGMPGVELLRQAKAISPATLRILLTGYSDLASIVGSVNDGEVFRFVSKPWNQADLMSTVNEAISIALALESAPPPPALALDASLAAVVMGDPATYRAVRELAGSACLVLEAPNLDAALARFAEHEVAVVVADLESERVDNTVLFKLLKEQHPATLVIVTTGASDSERIIELINEARIFRFVNKPVNLTLLQQHIVGALERYQQFRASPVFLQTQAARTSQSAHAASSAGAILGSLRAIGVRIRAALRSP